MTHEPLIWPNDARSDLATIIRCLFRASPSDLDHLRSAQRHERRAGPFTPSPLELSARDRAGAGLRWDRDGRDIECQNGPKD
jgi:hypothetical protein